jgi:CRP-like cAMP-binding protein
MNNPIWSHIFVKKTSEEKEILNILKKIPIFDGIEKKNLIKIGRVVHLRHFEKEELVFREGEPGVGMYMVKSGEVEVWIRNNESGKERKVATFSEGQSFGDVALFSEDSVRTATVKATKKTTLLGFCRPDLLGIISRDPELGSKILQQLLLVAGKRLAESNTIMSHAQNQITSLETKLEERRSNA